MRRRLTVVLCALLAFSMCGCEKYERYKEKKASDAAKKTEVTTRVTEEEPTETTAEPTPSPEPTETPTPTPSPLPTNTPTPTLSPTPTLTPTPAPVIVIEGEKETEDKYSTCTVTHVRTQKSWRYEGLDDIIRFSNDRATIDIEGRPDASALINDTLLYINKQTETLFSNLMETVEVPAYPEKKEEDENQDEDQEGERSGRNQDQDDDRTDGSTEPLWKPVIYEQSLDVQMCLDKIIGFRYTYTLTMPDGRVSDYSEYMLFDLRDGRFVSVEDLGRTAGAFGDHLFLMALTLYPDLYPGITIEEDAFARELNNVRYSYTWDFVEKDGNIVFRFWYPAGAFLNIGLEDKIFEADLDQVSMYMTSYARNLFTKEDTEQETNKDSKKKEESGQKEDSNGKKSSGSKKSDED